MAHPDLIHKWSHKYSILSIVAFPQKQLIFAGTQDSKILVVDKKSYNIVKIILLGDDNSNNIADGSDTKDSDLYCYDKIDNSSTTFINKDAIDSIYSKNDNANDNDAQDQLNVKNFVNTRSSVLCLEKTIDENFLFSAGADSLVRVWSINGSTKNNGSISIEEIATVYTATDIGDIFSVTYLDSLQTLVFGCQNASLLYMDNLLDKVKIESNLNNDKIISDSQINLNKLPHRRYDKFFNSIGPAGSATPKNHSPEPITLTRELSNLTVFDTKINSSINHIILEIPAENIIRYAHNGFIYSMIKLEKSFCSLKDNDKKYNMESIITGGGDGISKVWQFSKSFETNKVSIELINNMMDNEDSILSQAVEYPFLYCGLTEGVINIWDLNTSQLVSQLFTPDSTDITSISVCNDYVFAINEGGITMFFHTQVIQWNPSLGKLLSSAMMHYSMDLHSNKLSHCNLIAGDNEGTLTLWDLCDIFQNLHPTIQYQETITEINKFTTSSLTQNKSLVSSSVNFNNNTDPKIDNEPFVIDTEDMLSTLKKLIAYPTISQNNDITNKMAMTRCAAFLFDLFNKFGAKNTKLLPVSNNGNPILLAQFQNQSSNDDKGNKVKNILWYGHYDVVSAGNPTKWQTDPFTLTCENGYLKGRGVTDNKGPLISAIYSVATLLKQNKLKNNITFLVEGSEEIGSPGFEDICNQYKKEIYGNNTKIDFIFISNSSWVDREHPCLNYGLRGVINAEIKVTSEKSNGHTGVDGGIYQEPTFDLITILSKLKGSNGKILIPNFYEPLNDIEPVELQRLKNTIALTNFKYTLDDLINNWTKPSLSMTSINLSGSNNITVIPREVSIGVSIRLVPEQDLIIVKKSFINYINELFKGLKSSNKLSVTILNEAEPWLGNPTNQAYQVLREEIVTAWDMEPLLVREGGSIPSIKTLEKCFNAPVVQIPCGQSTDNAHLDNESLRIKNWTKMTEILCKVFHRL